jgi:hypothetical protein
MKLAATDPNELFLPHEFDGSRLHHGHIQNAWAGAYVVYGPGWKPEIVIGLDISNGIAPPLYGGKSSLLTRPVLLLSSLLKSSPTPQDPCMTRNGA